LTNICVSFISVVLLFFYILKNQLFYFACLIKKISSLEAFMKSAGFKDKGKGSPKNVFSLLKVGRRCRHCKLKIKANF
jgi:hypothetical protein